VRSRNALSILLAFYLILDAGAARGTAPGAAQGERLHKAADYRRMSAKVVRKIALPKGYHEGLFYDGEAIWVANGDGGKIWVVDIASGAVLAAIEPISNFAEALTRITDDTYFATEWFDKKVYKARISGNRLEAEGYSSVAPDFPAGAVWTGKHLYVITWQRGLGTKFYLLEMDRDMKVLRKISIDKIQEPSQLAWDGGSLWITSWHNSMVHKIDIEKLKISGAFRFPEPRATGIAWDGKFMWVVGTHSDLYQLEVI
jgi:glutamine cyclotransferase